MAAVQLAVYQYMNHPGLVEHTDTFRREPGPDWCVDVHKRKLECRHSRKMLLSDIMRILVSCYINIIQNPDFFMPETSLS